MPPYLTQKGRTYYYRQAVPAELRPILGQREIKKSLGRDFAVAVRECKRYAVTADEIIAQARTKLDSVPIAPYSWEGIARTRHMPLLQLTPELDTQIAALIESDREWRVGEHSEDERTEYHTTIRTSIEALRRQLATGNVAPMLPWAQQAVVGRGYAPEFSENEWRRLAFSQIGRRRLSSNWNGP